MDYSFLQTIAFQVCQQANTLNIDYEVYWYSPDSRKANKKSEIGFYDTQPYQPTFKHGCKCLIVFPNTAFQLLQSLINSFLPQGQQITRLENYRSEEDIGFDVYQRVHQLKLFIEPNNLSSEKFTLESMRKKDDYWYECQLKALQEVDPPLPQNQIDQMMADFAVQFRRAFAYLEAKNDPKAKLRVRRNSGFRHRMIRVDYAGTPTQRHGFADLALVFGTLPKLPRVELPRPSNPDRKPRSDIAG